MEYKTKRKVIIGISLFLLLGFYLFQNLSTNLRLFSFIFGLFIFYFIDSTFEINFKLRHYYYVMILLAFGILFSPLYFLSPNYDKILHLIMPIFGGILIFYIVDKKDLSMQWKLFIVFIFLEIGRAHV